MATKTEALPSFIINKTKSGLTKVSVSDFTGKMTLDIRHYYMDKADGKWKPTKQGCSIPLTMGKKFAIRLKKMLMEADAQGLEITEEES